MVEGYLKLAKESHEKAKRYLEEQKKALDSLATGKITSYEIKYREEKKKEINAYEKIIKINPQILKEEDYINLGNAYLGTLDVSVPSTQTPAERKTSVDKAIRSYNRALKISPKNIEARLGLSSTYFQMKDYNHAIEECTKSLAMNPQNANVYAMMGEIYRFMGKLSLSETNLRIAIEIDPKCIVARLSLANIYLWEEKADRALDELRTILDIDPNVWEANLLLKIIQDNTLAISKIEENLKEDPRNVKLLVELGRAYVGLGNLAKAVEAYEKAYNPRPNDVSIASELGRVLLLQSFNDKERIKLAIEILEKASAHDPKDMQIRITLVEAYKEIGAYEEVVKECKKLVSEDPRYALAWYYLGEAYEALGDERNANKAFKKSAKLAQFLMKH